jgi:hypothetical protein
LVSDEREHKNILNKEKTLIAFLPRKKNNGNIWPNRTRQDTKPNWHTLLILICIILLLLLLL